LPSDKNDPDRQNSVPATLEHATLPTVQPTSAPPPKIDAPPLPVKPN